jgi:hypothetical protein
MAAVRLMRILAHLRELGGDNPGSRHLCQVAADVTAMDGAGIMLLARDLPRGSVCVANRLSGVVEDLQYSLGEGPAVDAHAAGLVVSEPDLSAPGVRRWPAFAPLALDAGVGAVFSLPVRIGGARLGALNLYRRRPGPLDDEQQADAEVMARVAARAILTLQAGAAPGLLAAELETGANFQFVVHQAAGMVSVQLEVTVAEALIRLRAYAFRVERPVDVVARDVVARRLRFTDPMIG